MWHVGIDLHKKFLVAAAYDENEKLVLEPTRVDVEEKQLELFFSLLLKEFRIILRIYV